MLWFKRIKVLKQGNQVVLPALKTNECLEITTSIEVGETNTEIVCLGLDNQGYWVNNAIIYCAQPEYADGAVNWVEDGLQQGFRLYPNKLPDSVHRLLVIASIKGVGGLDEWGKGKIRVKVNAQIWEWAFHGATLGSVATLKMIELHRKGKNEWSLRVEGHGFDGQLSKLVQHLAERPEAEEVVPAAAPAPLGEADDFIYSDEQSRLKRLQLMAPNVLDLYKTAGAELAKLDSAVMMSARLVLVLDHTAEINVLYENGQLQVLLDQLVGLSSHWNLSGEVDIFLAGQHTYTMNTVRWADYAKATKSWRASCPFESRVQFGRAMEVVRRAVYPVNNGGETKQLCVREQPVFVFWIMSHDVDDASMAKWQLRWASREPIFWQFMALTGQRGRLKSSQVLSRQGGIGGDFRFLDQLDELSDCALHNTDYFTVSTLGDYTLQELYEVMLKGYETWLCDAVKKGMVRKSE